MGPYEGPPSQLMSGGGVEEEEDPATELKEPQFHQTPLTNVSV